MEVERPSVPGKPGQRELQHPFLKTKIKIKWLIVRTFVNATMNPCPTQQFKKMPGT
jgi:hypothetical protein